jgi:hypothetical protein
MTQKTIFLLARLVSFALPALAQDTPSQVLIKSVNVFDGTSDALAMGQDELVEGDLKRQEL